MAFLGRQLEIPTIESGFRIFPNGWNNTRTPPKQGVFLAVDNANWSPAFGASDNIALLDDADDSIEYGFEIDASGNINIIENSLTVASAVETLSLSTDYDFVLALDDNLIAHYFLYDSVQSEWRRLYVGTFATSASLVYANDDSVGVDHTVNQENFGTGMPYENEAIDIAAPQVGDGSVSGGDPALPDADFVMQFTFDTAPSAGYLRINFRYEDSSNYWSLYFDGVTTMRMSEYVDGSPTVRGSVGPLSGGELITLIARGNTIEAWYDSTLAWSYSSANNFLRETDWEVNSLGTGGVISGLKVWKGYTRNEAGLGAELVTNGGFDTDLTGWQSWGVPTTLEWLAGRLHCIAGAASVGTRQSSIPTSGNVVYLVSFDYEVVSGSIVYRLVNDTGGFIALSTLPRYLIATGTNNLDIVQSGATSAEFYLDNVSVKQQLFSTDTVGNKLNQAVA